jgi:hypothetical protein
MGVVNLVLWIGGIVLLVLGYQRARGPWARYQALKEEDANASRYNAWRGGVREDPSATGASVAMAILRRQAQTAGAIGAVGIVLIVVGFLIK